MIETGKDGTIAFPVDNDAERPRDVGLVELSLLFTRLGLSSFGGGVSAWVHWAFVERRRLIGETEFAAALALARIMPGANVVNLAVLIGQRLRGMPGALAAALGLLVAPSLAVIALAVLYRQFAGSPALTAVLEGAAAAAVGLLIAMGVQSGAGVVWVKRPSGRRTAQSLGAAVILAAMFVFVGVLRLPMVPTVLCLGPLSIALAFFTAENAEKSGGG
ncbi:MAG TPA: chromate transporter [Xanthobacteraceae bacterium]|nr:chromate transporter [Xanthobacteraceae bacterium]